MTVIRRSCLLLTLPSPLAASGGEDFVVSDTTVGIFLPAFVFVAPSGWLLPRLRVLPPLD